MTPGRFTPAPLRPRRHGGPAPAPRTVPAPTDGLRPMPTVTVLFTSLHNSQRGSRLGGIG